MSYQAHIETIQQRFNTALSNNGLSAVLIYSGHQTYSFMDDNAQPFKVNPYFKYWLPLTAQQKSFLFIEQGQKPQLFLFLDDDYWHAQPVIPDGVWQPYFAITVIKNAQDVKTALKNKLAKTAVITEDNDLFKDWFLHSANPSSLLNELNYYRAYKTQYEIDCMKQANKLAAHAHNAAKDAFYNGKSELETHLAYLNAVPCRESALPYNNIVAFNEAASILHYDNYQTNAPKNRKTFLIDAGAQFNGYNSDISRTYINESEVDSEFTELFNAYLTEYYALLAEITLNKDYLAFHDSSHRRISKLLSQFELIKLSPEETYLKGYSRLFFPCGTGHYIGLQVHDIGGYLATPQGDSFIKDERYPFLRLRRPMELNTVFTVEPGIYFIQQLLKTIQGDNNVNWTKVNHFSQYGGFRYEDCIAITDKGVENLSTQGFDAIR